MYLRLWPLPQAVDLAAEGAAAPALALGVPVLAPVQVEGVESILCSRRLVN